MCEKLQLFCEGFTSCTDRGEDRRIPETKTNQSTTLRLTAHHWGGVGGIVWILSSLENDILPLFA